MFRVKLNIKKLDKIQIIRNRNKYTLTTTESGSNHKNIIKYLDIFEKFTMSIFRK